MRADMRQVAALLGALFGGLACSTIVDPDPGPPPLTCSPGDTNPCRCADGSYGVQYCDSGLGSYGACRDQRADICERRREDDGPGAAGRSGPGGPGER